jgi:alpha/beta hydrolase fold
MERRIPRYTYDGVRDAEVSAHPFATEDRLGLNLTRFHRADCDDVVLVIHGLTLSSDMFVMPEHENLVNFLLDQGLTDVWALDYRMSNRFPYDTETHRFTLDDVAGYDHPAALAELRRTIGNRRIHVIAHCVGSITFLMSLFGGAVDDIASVVANSVALTPRVSRWTRLKLALGPALIEYVLGFSFLDPRFGNAPAMTRGWMFSRLVSLFHRECRVRSCHLLSFMWGSGHPALYSHDKLEEATHERIADLCGGVGVHYYRNISKMVRAGRAVKYDETAHPALPGDYLSDDRVAAVGTPVLFLAGDHNHVFTDSNIVCYETLSRVAPGRHTLQTLPGYGHMDPFMARDAHRDVFPYMVDFIRQHSPQRTAA